AADRDDPAPPPGLAVRTIARLAAVLVEHRPEPPPSPASDTLDRLLSEIAGPAAPLPRPAPADRPEVRAVGGRFRLDWAVACGLGMVAAGLGLSFVGKLRHEAALVACRDNLRTLFQGVAGYADDHAGRLPEVGGDPYPTAGSFVAALKDAGHLPDDYRPGCPADPDLGPPAGGLVRPAAVGYTFPLGHQGPGGQVVGLRRTWGGENDLLPVSADLPAGSAGLGGPTSPHGPGQNVLYLGGHARYATTPAVGLDGDDIYRNRAGRVAAGVDRTDTVLGRGDDRP
ncbi:MAG: hypothetical protein K2X87_20250, partial [Gemmataceae bacterium]|nr:hypothetical protein [Gemmataceae bacterium]